jgi:hypothetical protein
MDASRSLRPYFLLEARAGALRGPLIGLLVGAVMIAGTHAIVPLLPRAAIEVLETSFAIRGKAALLLLNDYLALYAAVFFGGFAELLRAVVAPREERQLELLLSKPVSASTLVRARAVPVLMAVWLTTAALGCATAAAIAPIASPGSATATGALGASIVVGSAVVIVLALLAPLLVRSRDGFEALVVGFVAWLLPLLPASVFLYRPDVFEGRPGMTSALVAPANLLWHDAAMPRVALVATALAACLSFALLALAGRVLRRTGVA